MAAVAETQKRQVIWRLGAFCCPSVLPGRGGGVRWTSASSDAREFINGDPWPAATLSRWEQDAPTKTDTTFASLSQPWIGCDRSSVTVFCNPTPGDSDGEA